MGNLHTSYSNEDEVIHANIVHCLVQDRTTPYPASDRNHQGRRQSLGDEITVGARLRILRRWRGMTLTELAGLAGVSFSYLSMVERGQRMLGRRSYISAVAAALKVSETDLIGGPHLSADHLQSDPHMAIPAPREAFQANKLSVPAVDH